MQEGHFIFFDVVTSDGTRVDPDESNTIMLHFGARFSIRLRDIPPGCNGGLAYFTYNGTMFHPHEYAMVREGRILVFAKAVINTPEAEAYLHEYTMYVQGMLPPAPVDKKDPVHDDAIDFFLQEELDDDARPFPTHRLKEGVPLVLKSGTSFRVDARTLVSGSEAYVSRFEYDKHQRCMGSCTVVDGEHQLVVRGYRRLSKGCGDVIYTERTFTIFGQPPFFEEKSTKMADAKGWRNAAYYGFIFRLVTSSGECHILLEEEPVTLPSGTVFQVEVTASAPQDVASINDYKYEGPCQSHMCTAVDGKKTLTVYAQRKHDGGWCQHYEATFTIIGEPKVTTTKASARQFAVGLLGDTRNPLGNNWLISQGWELTLFVGDQFYVQSTMPGEIGRSLESFAYAGESHLQASVVRRGRHVVTIGYRDPIEFTIVGQHYPPEVHKAPSLSEENSTKMADTKEGSSYDLFVETCDDDPVCYPVSDDGCVEVPAGTRFRFVATSKAEDGRKATEEDIRTILEEKRIQRAIWFTTETLNHERESLEKTWEKIQAAQDKLCELKVEQAKLAQTK